MSAVMLKKNAVDDLRHLRGKKACFPLFDGYGEINYTYFSFQTLRNTCFNNYQLCNILVWNSFLLTLKLENIEMHPNNETVKNFFEQSCAILSSDQNSIKECDFDGKI